ncbi:hypothetical protein JCM33374_g3523 [Metschnikowia sp. JCM 33374]|nr:hypothetical protein JCM33374_g3523 [Metschnikowia sp. JCM 33374]
MSFGRISRGGSRYGLFGISTVFCGGSLWLFDPPVDALIAQVPTPKLNTPGPKDSEEDDEVSPQPGTKRHKFTRAENHEYWKSMEAKRKSEASKNASNGNSNHD